MVLLALDKCVGVTDGRADIIDRDAVFTLHLVEAHSSSQAPENNRNRQPRTADYRLAVTDFGINSNTLICVHAELIILPCGHSITVVR